MNTCCNNIYPSEDMNRWESCPSTMLANADNYYTKAEIDEKLEDIEISGDCMSSGDVQNMIDASVEPIEGSVEALSGTVGELSTDMENKADRSEIPSLSGYATEQWVEGKHYLTEHQSLENYYTKGEVDNIADTKLDVTAYTPTDLSNYYTKQEIENKHYLTEHQRLKTINNISLVGEGNITISGGSADLSNYYTKDETNDLLDDKLDASAYTPVDLSGYATEQWVENKHYLTEHQSLANYYTIAETDYLLNDLSQRKLDVTAYTPTDLSQYWTSAQTQSAITQATSGYATQQWVQNQGYLTEHQSLSDYATTATTTNINNALTSHTANTTVHVTQNDKTNWNGKANVVELTQAEYDALSDKDPDTIYIISDASAMPPYEAGTGIEISGNVISCTVSGGGGGDMSNYYTKAQTNDLLDDKLDASAYTPSDLSNYWTSAQTQSAIDAATQGKADASNVYNKSEINSIINNKLWCGTQAEYEALTNKDNNILYLIHE